MKRFIVLLTLLSSFMTARADEGMWLLSLLNKNIEEMQAMGCQLTAEEIYSVNQASLKDALVGLGYEGRPFRHFCTGEIISPEGLMMTNHHCGASLVQQHTTLEHNYIKDGFWAYSKDQELANPGITASILQYITDVTAEMQAAVSDGMGFEERQKALTEKAAEIESAAIPENNSEGLAARVIGMFAGNQFFLFVHKVYRDVRLVGTTPECMGGFGGDTDNWMWPRHTCDFNLFRIYTAPDGTPAPYSEENIPLSPKHYFPVSAKGVQESDFAMVMGFPGGTDRYTTSFGLEAQVVSNAVTNSVRTDKLDIINAAMAADEKVRIQYASKQAGIANTWKYAGEQNKALEKLGTRYVKEGMEKDFTVWIDEAKGREKMYGEVLPTLEAAYAAISTSMRSCTYTSETMLSGSGPEIITFAYQMGPSLEKLCDKNITEEQRRELTAQMKGAAEEYFKDYNAQVDEQLLAKMMEIFVREVPQGDYPEFIKVVTGRKFKGDYTRFAAAVMKSSPFVSLERFLSFVEAPKAKVLKKDLAIQCAVSFAEKYNQLMTEMMPYRKMISTNNRLYLRAMMEMYPDKNWYPDANSTLRLTYGKVCSYSPADAVTYKYYTTFDGVMAKEGPANGEFEIPAKLKALHGTDYEPYGTNGELVVNFITDNDITGGNSGSPVINARGELIGAAFDGNSEAMSGDIDFENNLQRCICVDTRYVLFVIDRYAGAKNLIDEMTIVF